MKKNSVVYAHKKHLIIRVMLLLIIFLQCTFAYAKVYRGTITGGFHCGGFLNLCLDAAEPVANSCSDNLQKWYERDPYLSYRGIVEVNLIVNCFQCNQGGEPIKIGGWWSSGTQYPKYSCYTISKKDLGDPDCKNSREGNPCDAATGNKFQEEVDYHSNTLNFVRYYNSLYESESVLGKQWTHHPSLTIADSIKINRPDGKVLEFTNETGAWKSDADITDTLTPIGLSWAYKTHNDDIETYNEDGQLLSITSRSGKTTLYTYTIDHKLEQVTDPFGRSLNFSYDSLGRLITLTTPDNTQIHYVYDDITNNLISVIYPDNTPGDLNDNPRKIYLYENANFPHHLTGMTNENQLRYATWAYNNNGLAILSERANGTEKVEMLYNNDTTTVTDALGHIKTYTFETHYDIVKPKTIQSHYNDGKQLVTKTYHYYPENGWVKEIIDYNGHITYYEYNSRGLITLETQAKGTPDEYHIVTTWHPNYRLPATRSYPDKTVRYDYDNNGQLTATHTTANP